MNLQEESAMTWKTQYRLWDMNWLFVTFVAHLRILPTFVIDTSYLLALENLANPKCESWFPLTEVSHKSRELKP